MSIIHIQRIRNAIEKLFAGKIDLSDHSKRKQEEKERAFLSRGLSAYVLNVMANIDASQAGKAVTDGFDDNGIDAIYFDKMQRVLYVVQSKWISEGKGGIKQQDSKKFLDGFRDLVNLRLGRFNERTKSKEDELRAALYDSEVNFVLILAHTGTGPISEHVQGDLDTLVGEMNTPDEVVSYEVFNQKRIYDAVSGHAQRHKINLEIMLHEWGYVQEPYRAYYGQVDAGTISDWWGANGRNLFARNIRDFRGSTDVNDSLTTTLRNKPQNFWYFNNGITILCSKISKKPIGGSARESGIFECEGVNVVNGAQTVGVIGTLGESLASEKASSRVLVRLISLESCPQGFDKEVTRATNTQNRIERRDFASLDPNQQRLASELLLDGKRYAYKSGDEIGSEEEGCSITEATIALACANDDVSLAIQAKREIGRLWDNMEQPPYSKLFNDNTTAVELWRAVEIMRIVEKKLKEIAYTRPPRGDMVAIHGNRLILHCVFMDPKIKGFRANNAKFTQLKDIVKEKTEAVFVASAEDVELNFENSYLATLFKNLQKCRDIRDRLLKKLCPGKRISATIAPVEVTRETLFDNTD
ncbi:MAG: AIPR family protein [Planctomycetota bacterium]|jgi:hypothetical protein